MNSFVNDLASDLQKKWWFKHKKKSNMDVILNLLAEFCNIFPFSSKKKMFIIIDSIGLLIFRISNILLFLLSSCYIINGNQKDNNKNICFLLKGNPDSFSSLTNIMYNSITSTKQVNISVWKKNVKNQKKTDSSADALLLKSDTFYQTYFEKKGFIIIPEFVSFHLPVKNDIESIIRKTPSDIREDIIQAKKTGYTYEIRNDEKSFSLFYYQMYYPYIKWRHQESKKIASYATIRHLAGQGAEILFIKHHSNIIFGGMFLKNNNKIETHYAGLMEGKFNHLHNGVMALSYYYLIKIAKEYGCDLIDFGTASSFISDGLYQYKKKWNMIVTPTSPFFSDIFAIKIINNNSPITEFIENNPVHCLKNNQLGILSGLN